MLEPLKLDVCSYKCSICSGRGCLECGQTGIKTTATGRMGDFGIHVQGDIALTESGREFLKALIEAVAERFDKLP